MGVDMKYSIPGLGARLRRARNSTGLSQTVVAERLGISWMTVHRWERSQRGVPDHLLMQVTELYDKPLRWFLTLEDGDLTQDSSQNGVAAVTRSPASVEAAARIFGKLDETPAKDVLMIEKVVGDIIDANRQVA